jgi:predicted small lipoprotein YifL
MLKEIANASEDAVMNRDCKIKIIRLGIILMLLSCVSACGQKGDLYLPPEANISASDFSNTA